MAAAVTARRPLSVAPSAVMAQHADRLPAAGYIRVSSGKQADGYSPEIQREAIKEFARQQGYDLVMVAEDVKAGRTITRDGYQRVMDAVRGGVVACVIVYLFDRWGRDGGEWVIRARELERAGVPFLSVQEGREEGGMIRFIRAGMAEEYARQLAKRVRPAKERAVREGGKHQGITPFGYKRLYPAHEGSSRYVAGLLVPDPATAWLVQELFRRYAEGGGWSLRTLASWVNTDPACPRSPRGNAWTICNVQYVLRNPVYVGRIRYNRKRLGFYDTSAPGSEFVAEGRHEPLIDAALFDAVQARLTAVNLRGTRTRLRLPDPLGAGLFVCGTCGGPMTTRRRRGDEGSVHAQYVCLHGHTGVTVCRGRAYLMTVAHTALLGQVKRLQGRPWRPSLLAAVLALPAPSDPRTALQRVLDTALEEMKRHIRRFSALVEDPTPQELVAHRAIGREISERITAVQTQLAALPPAPASPSVPDLQVLHEQLTHTDLRTVIDALTAQGDEEGRRELVLGLVATAVVAERVPAVNTKWMRVAVTWTADVQLLLDAGLLVLAPDVDRPDYPATPQELRRQTCRRYRARKKDGLIGVVPPARTGVALGH